MKQKYPDYPMKPENTPIPPMTQQQNTPPAPKSHLVGYLCDDAGNPEYYVGVDEPVELDDNFVWLLVYNKARPDAATACVGLSFAAPTNFFHEDYPLLEVTWKLAQRLKAFLQSPHPSNPRLTHWQVALELHNHIQLRSAAPDLCRRELTEEQIEDNPAVYAFCYPLSQPIPDYSLLSTLIGPGFATVARDYDSEYCLAVNPVADSTTSAFFELYSDTNARRAASCVRISFLSPDYVSLPATESDWILHEEEKKRLVSFLSSHRRGRSRVESSMSNWQYALALWNVEMGFIDTPEEAWSITEAECAPRSPHAPHPLPLSLPMPDYSQLS